MNMNMNIAYAWGFAVALTMAGCVGERIGDLGDRAVQPFVSHANPPDGGFNDVPDAIPDASSATHQCESDCDCFDDNESRCQTPNADALSCAALPDGSACDIDGWTGHCISGLCCWSCVTEAPTGGSCPFMADSGSTVPGQCVTGRCFTNWETELQPLFCR